MTTAEEVSTRIERLRAELEALRISASELKQRCRDLRSAGRAARGAALVSVVCIAYNEEKFIAEAIASLLAQTYAPLDIIILDDASTDATAAVITDELARHPHRGDVRFIRNERNLGIGGNHKKGLSLARGDFICGLAGDDVMLPTMVERMVDVWRRENVSLVTTNVIYIDENSKELNRYWRNPSQPYDASLETLARECNNALCFGAAMGFERRLYEEFGYPPEHLSAEDIMLPFYACLTKGARFIPEPLVRYRVHARNASLSLAAERQTTRLGGALVRAENSFVHLAHSVLMASELDRLSRADPGRFAAVAQRIKPLIEARLFEMARALVDARIELCELGITRPIGFNAESTRRPQAADAAQPVLTACE